MTTREFNRMQICDRPETCTLPHGHDHRIVAPALEHVPEDEITWETSPEMGGLQQACLIAGAKPELPL